MGASDPDGRVEGGEPGAVMGPGARGWKKQDNRDSPDGGMRLGLLGDHRVRRLQPSPPSPLPTFQPGGGLPPLTLCIPNLIPSLTSSHPITDRAPLPHPAPHCSTPPSLPLTAPAPIPPFLSRPLTAPASVPPGPPSAPRDLQYSLSRSPLALRLRWLPPADSGGRSDVTYSLLCLRCGREDPAGACEPCGPRVAFVPRQAGLRERAATLLHLRPGARYTVRVAALNGVSGPEAAAGATYAQVTVSTGAGGKAFRTPRARPSGPPRASPQPAATPDKLRSLVLNKNPRPWRPPIEVNPLPEGHGGEIEDTGDSVPLGQRGYEC